MISNADSMLYTYAMEHIRVKAYYALNRPCRLQPHLPNLCRGRKYVGEPSLEFGRKSRNPGDFSDTIVRPGRVEGGISMKRRELLRASVITGATAALESSLSIAQTATQTPAPTSELTPAQRG